MLRLHTIIVCAALLAACREEPGRLPGDAPVIIISIDTLRADRLPAYGSKRVSTPAFDRLAADGIVYENAYAHVPLTLPSHVSLLSGTLPFENGVRSNLGYRFDPKGAPTLPRLLAGRGYKTGGAVSAYVLRAETGMGPLFDWYDDSLEVYESATLGALQRPGHETVRRAVQWIDGLGSKKFFLFLHLFEPHTPYEPPEPFKSQYADAYDGEIATTDAILAAFLADLDERGLYDDALVILLSDHGEGLGEHGEAEHGMLLYRESLHVPLIVKLPGRRLAGRRVAAPAQLVDVLPTVLSLAGETVPPKLPGLSLLDLAEGKATAERSVYSETLYPRIHLGWSELRSVTDARHHYIEGPKPELFDIVADPRETRNLRDERRRDSVRMARDLSAVPLNLVAPGDADPEERARLAALGYLSSAPAETKGPRLNPRDHIAVVTKVQMCAVLRNQGRYREGAELCRSVIAEYPDLVDAWNQLAANLRYLGRSQEALDAYKEALRRAPQLVDSIALEVAKLELDLGNLDAAELNARQSMKLNPLESHLLLAAVALERRDLGTAENEARQALGRPDLPRIPGLVMLARVLVEQGRPAEALQAVERAAQRIAQDKAPPVATLASTRGDVLARMGRTAEAEAAFREEIARFPTTLQAYVRLAILLAQEHRFAEIAPTLERMVEASPVPSTYRLAAQVMADLGNEQAARGYRRRAGQRADELRRRSGVTASAATRK